MNDELKVALFCLAFMAVGALSANISIGYFLLLPVTFGLGFIFARKTNFSRETGALIATGMAAIGCILGITIHLLWRK
jgi:hypothetical protein